MMNGDTVRHSFLSSCPLNIERGRIQITVFRQLPASNDSRSHSANPTLELYFEYVLFADLPVRGAESQDVQGAKRRRDHGHGSGLSNHQVQVRNSPMYSYNLLPLTIGHRGPLIFCALHILYNHKFVLPSCRRQSGKIFLVEGTMETEIDPAGADKFTCGDCEIHI